MLGPYQEKINRSDSKLGCVKTMTTLRGHPSEREAVRASGDETTERKLLRMGNGPEVWGPHYKRAPKCEPEQIQAGIAQKLVV